MMNNFVKNKISVFVAVAVCLAAPFSASAAGQDRYGSTQAEAAYNLGLSKNNFIQSLQSSLAKSSPQETLKLFENLPAELSEDFDILYLKSALNLSAGNYKEASQICSSLRTANPGNQDALELGIVIATAQGDTKTKSALVNELLKKDPYNSAANITIGDDYFARKNYKQALAYYDKALVNDSSNVDAKFGVGRAAYYLKDDEKAKKTFKSIIEIDPTYAPGYSYLGKIAAANKENKIASSYAEKALELDSENYDYLMDYGMYENTMEHSENAIKAWTKAIKLQPDYFLAYAYRVGLYDAENMLDKACEDYKMVVKLNPDYYFAYEELGVIYLHKEQWTLAREAFEKCYEKQKDNISYPLMITYCYYRENNSFKAREFSDKVLRKMDRSSIEYAMLRVFHDRGGEMPLAQKIAQLGSRQQQGKMYFYLGLLYELYGGVEASREWYAKVLSMNCPMFFEYRLAEWSVQPNDSAK